MHATLHWKDLGKSHRQAQPQGRGNLTEELGRDTFPFRMLLMTPRYSGALSTGNFQPACHLTVTLVHHTMSE